MDGGEGGGCGEARWMVLKGLVTEDGVIDKVAIPNLVITNDGVAGEVEGREARAKLSEVRRRISGEAEVLEAGDVGKPESVQNHSVSRKS